MAIRTKRQGISLPKSADNHYREKSRASTLNLSLTVPRTQIIRSLALSANLQHQ